MNELELRLYNLRRKARELSDQLAAIEDEIEKAEKEIEAANPERGDGGEG